MHHVKNLFSFETNQKLFPLNDPNNGFYLCIMSLNYKYLQKQVLITTLKTAFKQSLEQRDPQPSHVWKQFLFLPSQQAAWMRICHAWNSTGKT